MITYEKFAQSPEEYAALFQTRGRILFQHKDMRDDVFRILKSRGLKVKKGSSRSQNIHPEYIADYVGIIETGFGNSMYRTYFAHLYSISWIHIVNL
jgi:hypothetical protein